MEPRRTEPAGADADRRPRDPESLEIRPIAPGDKRELADGFQRLSGESRYRRFLSPHSRLSASELRYFTEVDHHDHEAFVAIDPELGRGVGVARYVRSKHDPTVAELAVAVVDDWHGRGVGTRLVDALALRAREEGISRFTALVLAENELMLSLLSDLGEVRVLHREHGTVELTVELPDAGIGHLKRLLRALAGGEVKPLPRHHRGGEVLDLDALRAGLARRTSHEIELRETHISWVLLAGDRAYKLKKPLVLPFLDYGTPERRREMCREEVRLNSRLASEIYLGVRGVMPGPDGAELTDERDPRAIDYVVEMRRYDERRTLAATLDRGELTGFEVIEVARTLAGFHARCPRAGDVRSGARWIEREVDRNVEELLGVVENRVERERVRALAQFVAAFVASRWDELDERAERGLIRECHGDLRAEHVILGPTVSVVDCVEFDPGLRALDIADDLAFLLMDLTALGGERFAGELADAYRAAGGDPGDNALLSFFAVHRALVREKVLLVRAHQASGENAGDESPHAGGLLAIAERFSWRARLPLTLVICGVPASGKSRLASSLAQASGLPLLSSDLVRKGLAGVEPSQTASAEHYGEEFNRATYTELGRRAALEIREQGGVLVDATFRHRRDRDAFADAFCEAAPLLFLECVAPADVLARRAISRERDPARVSDATLPIVLRERTAWEPLDEVQARAHLVVRTDRPAPSIVADLLGLLDERL